MAQEVHSFWVDIKRYEDILTKDPNSYCFAQLSELYRKIGLLDDAIYVANRGVEAHPDYVGGHLALGRAYYDKGEKTASRGVLEQVVRMTPENHIAQKLLSKIYLEQGDLALAETTLEAVLALNPEDVESRLSLEALDRSSERTSSGGGWDDEELLEEAEIVDDDLMTFDEWGDGTSVVPSLAGGLPGAGTPQQGDGSAGGERLPGQLEADVGDIFSLDVSTEEPLPGSDAPEDLPDDDFASADTLSHLLILERSYGEAAVSVEDGEPDTLPSAIIPVDEYLSAEEVPPAAPVKDPLTTATLAEIYLAQGFKDQALKIYRELAEADPEDGEFQRRIGEIEAVTEAPPASPDEGEDVVSFESPGVPVDPQPDAGSMPDATTSLSDRAVAALEEWLAGIERRRACH